MGLWLVYANKFMQVEIIVAVSIVAPLTIVKMELQCPSSDEWIKNMKHYIAIKKNKNPIFCNNMRKPGEHCIQGNKPGSDKQMSHSTFIGGM